MNDQPIPRLDPEALKNDRDDVDLGSEAENAGHDHMRHEPGRAPGDDGDPIDHPIGGASPPAR